MSARQRNRDVGAAAWLPLALGLALAGCAAGMAKSASPAVRSGPPTSPEAARAELGDLELLIASGRRGLGLPDRTEGAAQGAAEATPEGVMPAEPEPPPAPTAAPGDSAAARESTAAQTEAATDPCRHTRAICHAAQRICELADYLAEDDARQRCARARQDCAAARQLTGC